MTPTPPSERRIWLVRHGHRLDFDQPDWCVTAARPHDTPLAASGHIQAAETAAWLARHGAGIAHIFVSPFLRTMQTATPIATALGLPLKVESGLAELFLAKWFPFHPKLPVAPALAADFPAVDPHYRSAIPPRYPENQDAAVSRCNRVMRHLAETHDGDLLLVSHGGAIPLLAEGLVGRAGRSVHPRLCCLVRLERHAGTWRIAADGTAAPHLSITEDNLRVI